MIRFEQVTKQYDNGHRALDAVSFELKNGEMAFLTGHSGAGKTTALKLILGVERANQGSIFLGGRDITRLKRRAIPELRRSIGMIFQNPHLLPKRTVFDNVALPLLLEGFQSSEIKRRVEAALEKVSLAKKAKLFPAQLSSGEQQRVGIARALVIEPQFMIADEPTGNLDPALAREIMELFVTFNKAGTSILIASHDQNLIHQLQYRVLKLEHGKLREGSL